MPKDDRDVLEVLKLELSFLENGGYGRSPRTPWRPRLVFQESSTCINFNSSDPPSLCKECLLMQFVPAEHHAEAVPCRHIPLNRDGETIDSFYRWGSQEELEEALVVWLRATIERLERERRATPNTSPRAS